MRGIYKKPFAESFPRNLPMEDFAVPNPEGICGLGPKACGEMTIVCHFCLQVLSGLYMAGGSAKKHNNG